MERLQAFVRQLMSDGDVRDLLYALQPLARLASARTRCNQQGVQPVQQEAPVAFPGLDPVPSAQHITSRQQLLELFAAVDDDFNGRINPSQFRGMHRWMCTMVRLTHTAAMELLGDELTGNDVATILDSFDIDEHSQGVDFESFVNIVEVRGCTTLVVTEHMYTCYAGRGRAQSWPLCGDAAAPACAPSMVDDG